MFIYIVSLNHFVYINISHIWIAFAPSSHFVVSQGVIDFAIMFGYDSFLMPLLSLCGHLETAFLMISP